MNVQYVIMRAEVGKADERQVYVLEVNPRGSRTVPFISKVTGVPMVKLAVQVMLGKTLRELGYEPGLWPAQDLVAVKAPVFSMSKLIGVDTHLGPEMKSTGEVMGVDKTFEAALAKALHRRRHVAFRRPLDPAQHRRPHEVRGDAARAQAWPPPGYRIYATEGTAAMIEALGIPVEHDHQAPRPGLPERRRRRSARASSTP